MLMSVWMIQHAITTALILMAAIPVAVSLDLFCLMKANVKISMNVKQT